MLPVRPRLPLLTGLLLALAFPPLHLVVPSFLALVPLAVWLERRIRDGSDGREAFRGGALAGVVAWGALLYWMPVALTGYSWLAVPAYVAVVTALAALMGAVARVVHRVGVGRAVPVAVALPLAWTAGEFARAHAPGPLAFPWLGLGVSLTGVPEWIGVAEVVGERGVTFWLVLVAATVAPAFRPDASPRGRAAWLVAATALIVAPPVWGVARAASLEPDPVARVAVIQPDVSQPLKGDPERVEAATREALARGAEALENRAGPRPDVVVLPEALVPEPLDAPEGSAFREDLMALSRRLGAPVVVGGLGLARGASGRALTNSVFVVDSAGLGSGRWDKHRLVPLVERVPLVPLPWFDEGFAGYVPGRGWSPLRVPRQGASDLSLGTMICYESAFGEVARELRLAGADVLVNVTNDGWFGREALHARTAALWQHPAHLVMRAVETRTGVVRAANTGISMLIDPAGRVTASTPLFEEAVTGGRVYTTAGLTPRVRWGDWVGWAAFGGTLLLLAWTLRRETSGERHPGGDDG